MVIVGPAAQATIEIILKQTVLKCLQMLLQVTPVIFGIATLAIERVEANAYLLSLRTLVQMAIVGFVIQVTFEIMLKQAVLKYLQMLIQLIVAIYGIATLAI